LVFLIMDHPDIAVHPTNIPMNDRTTCCIVGGGPAGVMLGFLLRVPA
jgi:NADPH-dependent 2,4-dienoyl-CoA reductase/sulfur reductase-like enzyme